ncbi:unnamed protein product [Musa hybrid cultivar]
MYRCFWFWLRWGRISFLRVQEQRLEGCLLNKSLFTRNPTCCLFLRWFSMSEAPISVLKLIDLDHEMKAQRAQCSSHNMSGSAPVVTIRLRLRLLESSRNHQQISTN